MRPGFDIVESRLKGLKLPHDSASVNAELDRLESIWFGIVLPGLAASLALEKIRRGGQ